MAYLAGAIDSDGSIGVKRSTYRIRVRGDSHNPSYIERVLLKQVTPQIPELLRTTFGGTLLLAKGQGENSKPLYSYACTNLKAVTLCQSLLPFLRVKRAQAEQVLELRETKALKYQQESYWFERDYPDWRSMEMITSRQAAEMLCYSDIASVSQAIRFGALLSTGARGFHTEASKIPLKLVERIILNGGMRNSPCQLIERQESIFQIVRNLNKIGINGTELFHRTGAHKPK